VTTTTAKSVRTVLKNPRPLFLVITARKGKARLKFDGRNFGRRRAKLYGQTRLREALIKSAWLKHHYARALRGWHVDVEIAHDEG
jgi:hypothetical protein